MTRTRLTRAMRGAGGLAALSMSYALAAHAEEPETVGVWIKNTAPVPVTVAVDNEQVCSLEAPIMGPCKDPFSSAKTTCPTNGLKISCVANVPSSGAQITLKRGDGVDYKVRAGKDGALHLCIEPKGLTNCFGTKLN